MGRDKVKQHLDKHAEIAAREEQARQAALDHVQEQRRPYARPAALWKTAQDNLTRKTRQEAQALEKVERLTREIDSADDKSALQAELESAQQAYQEAILAKEKAQEELDGTPLPEVDPDSIEEESVDTPYEHIYTRLKKAKADAAARANGETVELAKGEDPKYADLECIAADLKDLLKQNGEKIRGDLIVLTRGINEPVFFIEYPDNTGVVSRSTLLTQDNIDAFTACRDTKLKAVTAHPQQVTGRNIPELKFDVRDFVTRTEFVPQANRDRIEPPQPSDTVKMYTFTERVNGCDLAELFTNERNAHYVTDENLTDQALEMTGQSAQLFHLMWNKVEIPKGHEKNPKGKDSIPARIFFEDGKATNLLVVFDPKTGEPSIWISDFKSMKAAGMMPPGVLIHDKASGRYYINTSDPAWGGVNTTNAYNMEGDKGLSTANPQFDAEEFMCHNLACNLYEMVTRDFNCQVKPEQQASNQRQARTDEKVQFDFDKPYFKSATGLKVKAMILRLSANAREQNQAELQIQASVSSQQADDNIHSIEQALVEVRDLQTRLRAYQAKTQTAEQAPESPGQPRRGRASTLVRVAGGLTRTRSGRTLPKQDKDAIEPTAEAARAKEKATETDRPALTSSMNDVLDQIAATTAQLEERLAHPPTAASPLARSTLDLSQIPPTERAEALQRARTQSTSTSTQTASPSSSESSSSEVSEVNPPEGDIISPQSREQARRTLLGFKNLEDSETVGLGGRGRSQTGPPATTPRTYFRGQEGGSQGPIQSNLGSFGGGSGNLRATRHGTEMGTAPAPESRDERSAIPKPGGSRSGSD